VVPTVLRGGKKSAGVADADGLRRATQLTLAQCLPSRITLYRDRDHRYRTAHCNLSQNRSACDGSAKQKDDSRGVIAADCMVARTQRKPAAVFVIAL
jgi:hypothetical protein